MKLALIGFGTVAQGLTKLLIEKEADLAQRYGVRFQVTAIVTQRHGSLYDPDGLDVRTALRAAQSGNLEECAASAKGWNALKVIAKANANVILENTPTHLSDGEPAMTHVKTALALGKHVITANKGPIALGHRELEALAGAHGAHLLFEGTVLSGTPILSLAKYGLGGCRITELKGILNGTTNYILTQMEAGLGYADALKQAQELGYAEADPSADVEGFDALAKIVILANVLMGADLKPTDVACEGITHLGAKDIASAKTEGKRWKLIGHAKREGNVVKASVKPTRIPLDDPLASVGAAMNALTFSTDVLKSVTITGAGAGGPQTGFALLSDLLELHRRLG